jgi:hypothetical protein
MQIHASAPRSAATVTNATSEAEWLSPAFLAGQTVAAQGTTVLLRSATIQGTLRRTDAMPLAWRTIGTDPGRRVEGTATAPHWTADRWREEIRRRCAGGEPRPVPGLLDHDEVALGHLLRDVLHARPEGIRDERLVKELLTHALTPVLERSGTADVPAGTTKEAWDRRVNEAAARLQRVTDGLARGAREPWSMRALGTLIQEVWAEVNASTWAGHASGAPK